MLKLIVITLLLLFSLNNIHAYDCLTFSNESDANTALTQINSNFRYPIYSINAKTGFIDYNAQQTTSWAVVRKAHEIELWYFQKPDEEMLENVGICEIQEFNPDWVDNSY